MIPISDSPRARRFPWVMLLLVGANVAVFIYEVSLGRALGGWVQSVGLVPSELLSGVDRPPLAPGPIYVTVFTSMFVHGGFLHLGSNMLYLWVFGDNVEDAFGHGGFLLFYLGAGLAAGLTHAVFNPASTVPSVGASGAIAGALGAYLLLFPDARVRTLIFLGPFFTLARVPAAFLIGFWFLTQLVSGLLALEVQTAQTSGVAVWAHIGGFVTGVGVALTRRGRWAAKRQSP